MTSLQRKLVALSVLVIVALLGLLCAQVWAQKKAERLVAQLVDSAPREARIKVGAVRANVLHGSVTLSGVKAAVAESPVSLEAQQIVIRDYEVEEGLPQALDLSIRGLSLNLPQAVLAQVGYETPPLLFVDLDFFREKERGFILRRLNLGSPQVCDIEAQLSLAPFSQGDPPYSLRYASVAYRDHSFFTQMFRAVAGRDYDPAIGTRELDRIIAGARAEGKGERPLAALAELRKFAEKPGQIRFTLHPPEAVPLQQIKTISPEVFFDKLGVTIEYLGV